MVRTAVAIAVVAELSAARVGDLSESGAKVCNHCFHAHLWLVERLSGLLVGWYV